ncbi:FAD-dependent monooxygenase [Actinoplanes sp. NPDC051851]|uniref:FAD-dependent monooxygenase n=1 Tax=Actinoplanes sp. NPDC051851 TaxID=3154753 RepID=UPI00341A64E4
MANSRVLISGSGVAGPALAFWLVEQGYDVTVVERAPELRAGGYKVDVRGAATTVLQRMGLHDAAKAEETGMRTTTYVKRDGRVIASLPASLLMGRRGDDLEIMRGDLGRILYDATAGDATYVFGDAIAAMTEDADGVDVTFASGRTGRYAFVVGADGLHSATRRLAFGEVEPHHLGAYISIFSAPNVLGIDREEMNYAEPGRLTFAYALGADQPATVGIVFAAPELSYDRRDVAAQKRLVREAMAGLGWRTADFLAALDDAPDFYFDAISQVEMPRWSSGRVVLLGDAGYCPSPASGQGTSLALVGAYVLAEELAKAGGAYATAFAAYEGALRSYVEKNVIFGRKMVGDMVPGGRFAIAVRNYGMRTLRFHPRKEQVIERVLAPLHEAANAITI